MASVALAFPPAPAPVTAASLVASGLISKQEGEMLGLNRGLFIGLIVMVICLGTGAVARAQSEAGRTSTAAAPSAGAPPITAASTPMDLAHAALAAMGGDKFKNLKSMVLVGSVDLYAPNSTQSIPGKFV